ncbi:MAG: helix-turn-helix domain-containing protein [Jiangellaceae bacterium]
MDTAPGGQVRRARERAGLSQRELAKRSGVHQPNIAVIEAGRVVPSPRTLERLLRSARERPSVILDRHRDQVREIVAGHGGHDARVFGSVARGTDTLDSDMDLLIRFDPGTSIFDVVALARELEDLLGVHVDIASEGADGRVLARARSEAVPV